MKDFQNGSNLPWFSLDVNTIIIKEGVTTIGDWAFSDSDGFNGTFTKNVKEIRLPSTLKSIGDCAFFQTNIRSITIPANVEKIGNSAFFWCFSLSDIKFETGSKLKTVDKRAFSSNCSSKITIPESVENIEESAFFSRKGFNEVWLGSNIKSIGASAFNPEEYKQRQGSTYYTKYRGNIYINSVIPPESVDEFAFGYNGGHVWYVRVPIGAKSNYTKVVPFSKMANIDEYQF